MSKTTQKQMQAQFEMFESNCKTHFGLTPALQGAYGKWYVINAGNIMLSTMHTKNELYEILYNLNLLFYQFQKKADSLQSKVQ